MLRRLLKNERGLTLVELLAVVVILGIIAGIAVPSIGGLIDNTKKDAHVANARQVINAAKLAAAGDPSILPGADGDKFIPLEYLEENGYIETLKDPDNSNAEYNKGTVIAPNAAKTNMSSYVKINKSGSSYTYSIVLDGNQRDVKGEAAATLEVPENSLGRDSVRPN